MSSDSANQKRVYCSLSNGVCLHGVSSFVSMRRTDILRGVGLRRLYIGGQTATSVRTSLWVEKMAPGVKIQQLIGAAFKDTILKICCHSLPTTVLCIDFVSSESHARKWTSSPLGCIKVVGRANRGQADTAF